MLVVGAASARSATIVCVILDIAGRVPVERDLGEASVVGAVIVAESLAVAQVDDEGTATGFVDAIDAMSSDMLTGDQATMVRPVFFKSGPLPVDTQQRRAYGARYQNE